MRRYVEAVALHVWRVPPKLIRTILDEFRNYAPFVMDDYVENLIDPAKASKTYGLREFHADAERAILRDLFAERETILTANALGTAGQRYVRFHLRRCGRYKSVTADKFLGDVADVNGDNEVDCFATDTMNGRRYAISVKNTRDFLELRQGGWVSEIEEMARAHSTKRKTVFPWIAISFATPEAIADCEARGVRCTPIGCRVAPEQYKDGNLIKRSTPAALRRLYATIGPEPFRYVGKQRVHEYDEDFLSRLRDVA